jgi:hypothetical protein
MRLYGFSFHTGALFILSQKLYDNIYPAGPAHVFSAVWLYLLFYFMIQMICQTPPEDAAGNMVFVRKEF